MRNDIIGYGYFFHGFFAGIFSRPKYWKGHSQQMTALLWIAVAVLIILALLVILSICVVSGRCAEQECEEYLRGHYEGSE